MATQSIISVEIEDSKFQDFNKTFEKFKKSVGEMPKQWGAIGKEIGKIGKDSTFDQRIAALSKGMKQAAENSEKFGRGLKDSDRTASSLVRNTKSIAGNIKDATFSLLKWGSVLTGFAGLLAGGGLFGISRMAQSISGQQATARGLASPISSVNAATNVYGQMLGGAGGVEAILTKIEHDLFYNRGSYLKSTLGAAGMNSDIEGKTATDILPRWLEAMKIIIDKMPQGMKGRSPFLENQELSMGMGQGAAVTLSNIDKGELAKLEKEASRIAKENQVSEKTATIYADAVRRWEAASDNMEKTFLVTLLPLIPALEAFSKSFANTVKILMNDPLTKKWIAKGRDELLAGVKYMGTPEFKEDIHTFLTAIDMAAGAVWEFAQAVSKAVGYITPNMGATLTGTQHALLQKMRGKVKAAGGNPNLVDIIEKGARNPDEIDSELAAQAALHTIGMRKYFNKEEMKGIKETLKLQIVVVDEKGNSLKWTAAGAAP